MPTESDFFNADQAEVWVQPGGPNTTVYLLPCANTDAIDAPGPDVTTRMCRTANGWKVSHRSRGSPGPSTMTIDTYMSAVQSWLSKQKESGCQIPVYVTHGSCLNATFLNYDVVDMLRGGLITSKGGSGWARGRADAGDGAADASLRTYDLSGWPEAPEAYPLVATRRTIAEAEQLMAIEFCNSARCLGPCGPTEDVCTDGVITAEETGGLSADVWYTTDGWATGAATNAPFGAVTDEAAGAVVCFPIDRTTTRTIVGRATTDIGVAVAEIGYTDNLGAAAIWAQVPFGAANEFFIHGGSIWAVSGRDIWAGGNLGNIYHSIDAGMTWTNQGLPLGANAIYSIHFIDANYGMAVGAGNFMGVTVDGGDHWTAVASPNAGVVMTGVRVIDNYRAWACSFDGTLYYTNDFGTTWTARTLPTTPTALGAIDLIDEYAITTVGYTDVGGTDYPCIFRTFNGGMDWEYYLFGTAFAGAAVYGLRAVKMCSYNHLFAVGEADAAGGVVLELENA